MSCLPTKNCQTSVCFQTMMIHLLSKVFIEIYQSKKALLGKIERFTFFAGSPQNSVTESLAVEQARSVAGIGLGVCPREDSSTYFGVFPRQHFISRFGQSSLSLFYKDKS